MLIQKCIEPKDIDTIIKVWQEIFPKEILYTGFNGLNCFEYSFIANNIGNHHYYLYYDNGEIIGLSGLYDEPNEMPKESAWLGWFGVLEKYRNKGYGTEIIKYFESEAKKLGYKYCRVYTEDSANNKAIAFYEKCGYTFEKYDGIVPADCNVSGIQIGSKTISDKKLISWNNREIYFE